MKPQYRYTLEVKDPKKDKVDEYHFYTIDKAIDKMEDFIKNDSAFTNECFAIHRKDLETGRLDKNVLRLAVTFEDNKINTYTTKKGYIEGTD